jgi:two-component sensor histidine kinase
VTWKDEAMTETTSGRQQSGRHDAGDDAPRKAAARPFLANWDVVGRALESGKIAICCLDIASDRMTCSANFEALHGLPSNGFDGTFSAFLRRVHSDDQPGVSAAMREALENGKPYRVTYRLPGRPQDEARWLEAFGACDRATAQIIGLIRDVTEHVNSERRLRIHANQHHAAAQLAERALLEGNLENLLDEAAKILADMLDVELVEILEMVAGEATLLLRAGVGWPAELIGSARLSSATDTHAGFALASATPVVIEDLGADTRFTGPSALRDHGVVSGMIVTIAAPDGRAYGVLGAYGRSRRQFDHCDVSLLAAVATIIAAAIQRRQFDQRHELMIRELRHRSGNLFSQLLALFSQTAAGSRSVAELATKYQARVLALANAHRLITEGGWKSASLVELFRTLLAPYLDRVTLNGPHVFLEPDPAFALSTVVHEFATNASRHGSLSEPAGRLDVTWSVKHSEHGLVLDLDWKERNGPAPKRMRRPGFGSKLIDMVIERQLNGEIHRSFDVGGLHSRLVVPLTHQRWPDAADAGEPHAG